MQSEDQRRLVDDIRKWLQQDNIYNAPQDQENILKFLWGCKFQINKVKYKMKNFYEMRRSSPELFNGRDPFLKNLEILLTVGAFFPLPIKSDEGHNLLLVKAGAHDPAITAMTDVFKIGIMSVDLLMELDENVTRRGVTVIVDLKGIGLQHALQMTPGLIRKMVRLWQDCYPIRICGMDFINAPASVDLVLNIFRWFLGPKLKRRLRVHGSQMQSLHKVIDPKLLPKEYGGTLGSEVILIDQWKRKIQTYRDWFLSDVSVN